jgi:hypothetical protein
MTEVQARRPPAKGSARRFALWPRHRDVRKCRSSHPRLTCVVDHLWVGSLRKSPLIEATCRPEPLVIGDPHLFPHRTPVALIWGNQPHQTLVVRTSLPQRSRGFILIAAQELEDVAATI